MNTVVDTEGSKISSALDGRIVNNFKVNDIFFLIAIVKVHNRTDQFFSFLHCVGDEGYAAASSRYFTIALRFLYLSRAAFRLGSYNRCPGARGMLRLSNSVRDTEQHRLVGSRASTAINESFTKLDMCDRFTPPSVAW